MKYKLDYELEFISKQKAPRNISFYPLANLFLGLWSLKSDDNVEVIEFTIDGYKNGKINNYLIQPWLLPVIVQVDNRRFINVNRQR